jgi:hypothetical protein
MKHAPANAASSVDGNTSYIAQHGTIFHVPSDRQGSHESTL